MSIRPRGPWCSRANASTLEGGAAYWCLCPTGDEAPNKSAATKAKHVSKSLPARGFWILRGPGSSWALVLLIAPPRWPRGGTCRGHPACVESPPCSCCGARGVRGHARAACNASTRLAGPCVIVNSGIAKSCKHRSHFGSRYTLGRCGNAGLFSLPALAMSGCRKMGSASELEEKGVDRNVV